MHIQVLRNLNIIVAVPCQSPEAEPGG